MASTTVTLEKIVSLCKRRGFVYPSAEIYSGLNGVYDFGPLGALLKQNIKHAWLEYMTSFPEEVVLVDGSILGAPDVWKASGHVDNFSDPLVDCLACKKRFRADEFKLEDGCPNCGPPPSSCRCSPTSRSYRLTRAQTTPLAYRRPAAFRPSPRRSASNPR